MISRIAILGTGLLGTSVGLALRAAGFRGTIAGWNRSPEHGQVALTMGAIDSIAADPLQAAREPGHVLCRAHLRHARLHGEAGWRARLRTPGHRRGQHQAHHLRSRRAPLQHARARGISARPSHGGQRSVAARRWPMRRSFAARSGCLPTIPNAERSPHSAELVKGWREWVAAMGSKTIDLDPVRHDELVAWVSHLPQFTATALSALLEEEVGDAPELKDVGGRALREMTRLGASPYSMWRDIAYTNTEAVKRALHALEQRLAHLRENLRTPGLRDEFEQANKFRRE
jgi:prephenate dehydrogenase